METLAQLARDRLARWTLTLGKTRAEGLYRAETKKMDNLALIRTVEVVNFQKDFFYPIISRFNNVFCPDWIAGVASLPSTQSASSAPATAGKKAVVSHWAGGSPAGYTVHNGYTVHTGHWTLDTGHWTLDTEHWTLDTGHWTLDTGHWTLDPGHWTLDTGHWDNL